MIRSAILALALLAGPASAQQSREMVFYEAHQVLMSIIRQERLNEQSLKALTDTFAAYGACEQLLKEERAKKQ